MSEAAALIRSRAVRLLLPVVLISFFLGLGSMPLTDRDEGAFSESTREMFERGDFVSTYLNGEPRYDKPILIYWCQAVFVAALGPNEWAFRLPSAIFAALMVLVLYRFLWPRLGRETALAAGLILGTSLGVIWIGRAAIADALLNLLLLLTMTDVYRHYESPRRSTLLRVFLWMGLGLLTKGPVAVLVPGGTTLLFYGLQRRWGDWLRAVFDPLGLSLLLAVSLPWYLVQYSREGMPFIEGFFVRHNVDRFLSPLEGHGGALFYYLVVFLVVALPWTGLLLRSLGRLRSPRRLAADRLELFCWLWVGFFLVFFTFSGTKLPHYALLGFAPLVVIMARRREDLSSRWLALLPVWLFLTILAALPWLVPALLPTVDDPFVVAMLTEAPGELDTGYTVGTAAALGLAIALAFVRRLAPWRALAWAGVLLALCAGQVVGPAVVSILQGPVKEAARLSLRLPVETVIWDLDNPSIGVYRDRATPNRRPAPGEAVITRVTNLERLPGALLIYRRGGIILARLPAGSPPAE